MHLDVTDLRDFYYRTVLGRATQKALRDQVLAHWSNVRGLNVAGFGFAVPLLRPFLPTARRVSGLMPAPQGVMHWPPELPNHSVLVEETQWPIATGHLDRLIVMHGLETSDRPAALMEECYRSLAATGRLLIIVPNRRGLWARRDGTPFGVGRPYSLGQIEGLLKDHGFEAGAHTAALFFPPLDTGFWMRSSRTLEKVGRRLSNYHAGGALIIEAIKQYPAPTRPGLRDAVRHPLRVLDGVAQPGFRPAWRGSLYQPPAPAQTGSRPIQRNRQTLLRSPDKTLVTRGHDPDHRDESPTAALLWPGRGATPRHS